MLEPLRYRRIDRAFCLAEKINVKDLFMVLCVLVCTCIYLCACTCTCTRMCACVCTCMSACVHVYKYSMYVPHVHVRVHVCIVCTVHPYTCILWMIAVAAWQQNTDHVGYKVTVR